MAILPFAFMRMGTISGLLYNICQYIGFTVLAASLYGFLFLPLIDFLRLVAWIGNIRPALIYRHYKLTKVITFGAICLLISTIITGGYINAHHPRATHTTIRIEKNAGSVAKLRIALVSDIHLGNFHGHRSLAKIVRTINEQSPDIVLLAGDIFDRYTESAIQGDLGAEFRNLKAKYGAYVVNGNHERSGGSQAMAYDYLVSIGVEPLFDSVTLIENSFYVVGRLDRSSRERKALQELLTNLDNSLPIILLDHQPFDLGEAELAGIDLQLSGHTHHGQLFPFNFVTSRLFECDWGLLQKGKTFFYISCGAGTWGPPIRTAGRSEVAIIDLVFMVD